MDLRQLEVFSKVYDHASFSRAATELSLTQPTVSGHIKQLEEDVGSPLFDRLGNRIVPTPAGDILYHYARRMLHLAHDAQQALDEFLGCSRGQLYIGGSTIPGEYLLPGLLGEFKQRYPDIRVTLRIDDSKGIIEAVSDGQIEIGVVGAKLGNAKIDYVEYLRDELVLTVSARHPFAKKRRVSMSDVQQQPFILRERGSGSRWILEDLLRRQGADASKLSVVAEMGSTAAVVQGIKAGVGVSILSRRAVADDVKAGNLHVVAVEDFSFARHFYIVTRRSHTMSPIGDVFHRFLIEHGDPLAASA